ncbi:MAG: hypothetical protein LBI71_02755, partial [Enterobacteriaceae bacterium]|nr:hypothetical protein [Enterobacteriaceae bacterium]
VFQRFDITEFVMENAVTQVHNSSEIDAYLSALADWEACKSRRSKLVLLLQGNSHRSGDR